MKKLLILAAALFSLSAIADFQIPKTPSPVNDYAGVIQDRMVDVLSTEVRDLRASTGVQMGVLIVPELDGTTIEDAAIKVAHTWHLGSKDKDDGLLLMISVKERKVRLEVGYGLEPIITDFKAKRILANARSYFKSGDYYAGVLSVVGNVESEIKAHASEITSKTVIKSQDYSDLWVLLVLILGVVGLVIYSRSKRKPKTSDGIFTAKHSGLYAISASLSPSKRKQAKAAKRSKASRSSNSSSRKSPSDDSYSGIGYAGSSFSSSDSSSSSSSGSDYGGGGGDFGGGGSSDSF